MYPLFNDYGLLYVDSIRVREISGQVLANLAEKAETLQVALDKGAEELSALGIKTPLPKIGFFKIENDCRQLQETISAEAIRNNPTNFSANAALRPLIQDSVFPTLCQVAGPGELLYLWQIDRLYDVMKIQRPKLKMRSTATFLESKTLKVARKAGLKLSEIFEAKELLKKLDEENIEIPALNKVEALSAELLKGIDALPLDENLLRKTKENLNKTLSRLSARVKSSAQEKQGRGKMQLEKIKNAVFPGGKLQERFETPYTFLAEYGLDFIKEVFRISDPWQEGHLLVELETRAI
jgi:uncharacterized protein YllA (UPF0747 family)